MKSKEFFKKAGALVESFVSVAKEALGIKPSVPFATRIKEGLDEVIMRQAMTDTMKAHPETTTLGWKPENKSSEEAMSSFIQMAEDMSEVKRSFDEVGMQTQELIQVITEYNSFAEEMNRACMMQTNNWRKMHGLPMRRRTMQERRRKSK